MSLMGNGRASKLYCGGWGTAETARVGAGTRPRRYVRDKYERQLWADPQYSYADAGAAGAWLQTPQRPWNAARAASRWS